MQILLDALLALFAAVGIAALGWLLFGRMWLSREGPGIRAVVPARGDGAGLEQTVRGALWLRDCAGGRCAVVIVDCGLNEQGRALAQLLADREPEVWLCPGGHLETWIKESELWMRKSNAMK